MRNGLLIYLLVSPPTSLGDLQVSSHNSVLNSFVGSSEPRTSPAQSKCSSSLVQEIIPKDTELTMSDISGPTLEDGWRFQVVEAGCHGAPLSSMFVDLGFSARILFAGADGVSHHFPHRKNTALKAVSFIEGLESRRVVWDIPEARSFASVHVHDGHSCMFGSPPTTHNSQMSDDRVVNSNTLTNTQETCHKTLSCSVESVAVHCCATCFWEVVLSRVLHQCRSNC